MDDITGTILGLNSLSLPFRVQFCLINTSSHASCFMIVILVQCFKELNSDFTGKKKSDKNYAIKDYNWQALQDHVHLSLFFVALTKPAYDIISVQTGKELSTIMFLVKQNFIRISGQRKP